MIINTIAENANKKRSAQILELKPEIEGDYRRNETLHAFFGYFV